MSWGDEDWPTTAVQRKSIPAWWPRSSAVTSGKTLLVSIQIGGLIASVRRTLSGLGTNALAPAPGPLVPAVPIRRSVQPNYVVCLECGFRGTILLRHLRTMHGLDPAAYRGRWKLAADYPLTAPAYSTQRAAMARELGLGRKPAAAEMPAVPRRPGRPRRAPAA